MDAARPLAIPNHPSEITAAWLSAALGAEITGVEPGGDTAGIAVTSRVFRLRLRGAGPERVVVKLPSPAWKHGSDLHRREVAFYRDFAAGRELPIPRCYYADLDEATGAFVLVLEDIDDGEQKLDGLDLDEAEAMVDGIAALHRSWWGHPDIAGLKLRGHPPDRIAETVATFDDRWRALEASGKYPIAGDLRAALPDLVDRYAAGMSAISEAPQTLIHSDLHVENFFLRRTPTGLELIIIDWQNACRGNCAFDLSHVSTSMKPELIAGAHDRLVARYHDRLGRPELSLDQLRADVAASIRHQFIGSANWFATFEAETLRDATTLQGHWSRLVAAVLAIA